MSDLYMCSDAEECARLRNQRADAISALWEATGGEPEEAYDAAREAKVADHARAVELRDAWRDWALERYAYPAPCWMPRELERAMRAILDAHGLRLEGE